jgi:putative hydrolase of the HAD superfamily
MPRHVLVFDLDDTLYPERQFAISGFRACEQWLIERHGPAVAGIVPHMTQLLDDGHMRPLFELSLKARVPSATDKDVDAFIDIYRDHQPEISLYPDAAWALDHFGDQGPLGLITDGQVEVQSSKVRALAIAPRFRHIVYTSGLGGRGFSKPHPLAFEQMEAALAPHVTPGARFVYVGDNPSKDFVTPNARGWLSVQVLKPFRIHSRATAVPGGEPHHVIEALTQLPDVLSRA